MSLIQTKEIIFSEKLNDNVINSNLASSSNINNSLSIKYIDNSSSFIENSSISELFLKSIEILGLPARAHNCLISSGVQRIIDLVNMSEQEVVTIKNFGKKSYDDLLQIMKDFGLTFGMNIDEKKLSKGTGEK